MTHISEGSVRDDLHREMSNRLSMSQIQFDISCSGRSLFNLVRSCFASSYACLDSDQYRTRLERNGSCTHLRLDTSDTTSRSSSDQIQLRDEPKHLLEKKVVSLHVVVEREWNSSLTFDPFFKPRCFYEFSKFRSWYFDGMEVGRSSLRCFLLL